MSSITDPHKPERGILQSCSGCGQVYHVDNGPDCDCDGRYHDEREQCAD